MSTIRILLVLIFSLCGGGLYGSDRAPGDEQHGMAGIGIVAGADTSGHGAQELHDHIVVRRVLDGGPALKAGILAGDEIVEIDGRKLAGMRFSDAVGNLLRGPLGSPVKLVVRRGAKRHDCVIVRDIVPVEAK